MYRIAYIIPYFGKLPKGFEAWLMTCRTNKTIDWLLFTDDKSKYDYPENVKVYYTTFEKMRNRFQSNFDFEIYLDRPWKICEYRPAFGEIFKEELKEYDFWGHCDMDMIWGDVRKFLTDDILKKYEKIGFQGHSTLYKNQDEVNSRYKTIVPNKTNYKEAFTHEKGYCFDEVGICDIYDYLKIPYFRETNFAHLDMFETSFFLGHLPQSDDYKNKYQIFVWQNGKLQRKYLKDKKIYTEEFMYLHFFCRPMKYKADSYEEGSSLVIYPDVLKNKNNTIDYKYIKKYGHCSALHFYLSVAYQRRKKLTPKKILKAIKTKIKNKKERKNSKNAIKSEKIK